LFAAPLEILRIKPGALLEFCVSESPGDDVLAVTGTAIMLSPSSKEGEEIRGNEVIRPRRESVAAKNGVSEGLESFDGLLEGCRRFEAVVNEDA
jgi:hypothetical protein